MSAISEKINFRCKPRLRSVLEEEERKTGVRISEQIRITLEKAYQIDHEDQWLPPALRDEATAKDKIMACQSQRRKT